MKPDHKMDEAEAMNVWMAAQIPIELRMGLVDPNEIIQSAIDRQNKRLDKLKRKPHDRKTT